MSDCTSWFELPVQVQAIFAVLLIADLSSLAEMITISDDPVAFRLLFD